MTKEDILAFLNNMRKSSDIDPTQQWIGTYNGRYIVSVKTLQMVMQSGRTI